jgi:putative pyruvate formate lyase activating enzyme
MDDRIHVSSIVLHRGEEPPISGKKGVVNVFFPSCNMQCIYCQNWEISCRGTKGKVMSLDEVCDVIIGLLPQSENNLGFVSPSHFVLQMIMIVEELRKRGHFPTIIYNTNGYDLSETIRSLEGIVDVWLPDFKYSDDDLAVALSDALHYSHFALTAQKEMVYQVGTTLHTDENGIARRGIIIRHLVLPGFIENSLGVLQLIADNLSPNLHISLMSQYYPPDNPAFVAHDRGDWGKNHKSQFADSGQTPRRSSEQETFRMEPGVVGGSTKPVCENVPTDSGEHGGMINPVKVPGPMESGDSGGRINLLHTPALMEPGASGRKSLSRTLSRAEYETVVESFHSLGFTRGWLQEYESHRTYRPDFSKELPFE